MKLPRFLMTTVIFVLLSPVLVCAKETKDIRFQFRNAEPVVFSHDFHLQKYNDNCKVCHNAIFNLKERRRFTMAEMEKTRSCGACHTGVKAFSVTDDGSCRKCHKGRPRSLTFRARGVPDVAFSHDNHLTKTGGKCRACHDGRTIPANARGITMAQMEKGKTCGACHNGKKAFTVAGNCGNCHRGMKPREITFKIKGFTEASFSHNVHLGMFKCPDCHTRVFPYKAGVQRYTMADMDKGKSCGTCHNGKEAFTTAGDCDKCHKGFKPGVITFKTDSGDVKFSHEFHLGMYKCADCHTKVFPFKAGVQHFGMGAMEGGKSCGSCHNGKDAFATNGDCDKCHKM